MSGIPVYTQSPINASKASGTTPQTALPQASNTASAPNTNSPTTTTASSTSPYPPARPGASVPAPTAAAQRYAPPLQATPTTKTDDTDPPAPQPGAVPTPLSRSTILPPPKAGESYQSPQQTAEPKPFAQQLPPQMNIPPPTSAYGAQPPSSSTATTNTPSASYPAAILSAEYGEQRQSLEHPPGYHQNAYASELTSDQRRAQEANESSTTRDTDGTGESVWNTAMKWAQQAGGKIQAAEEEVWRKINKE